MNRRKSLNAIIIVFVPICTNPKYRLKSIEYSIVSAFFLLRISTEISTKQSVFRVARCSSHICVDGRYKLMFHEKSQISGKNIRLALSHRFIRNPPAKIQAQSQNQFTYGDLEKVVVNMSASVRECICLCGGCYGEEYFTFE